MRDRDHHPVVGIQKSLQPVDRIQVQVVRRLIQQQRLRMPEQGLRQQYPDFLSALQFAHLAGMRFVRNIQTLK